MILVILVIPLFFSSALYSLLLLEFLFHLLPFLSRLGPKISGRDLLLVEECCNAPDPMRQVSASFSPSLPCHLLAFCILSCHHSLRVIMCISFCIRVRFLHPSIFPVVCFAIRHSYVPRRSPFVSCYVWVLNFLGMARGLPSGLGIAPVDRLSSFVPFGGHLILQRLTG